MRVDRGLPAKHLHPARRGREALPERDPGHRRHRLHGERGVERELQREFHRDLERRLVEHRRGLVGDGGGGRLFRNLGELDRRHFGERGWREWIWIRWFQWRVVQPVVRADAELRREHLCAHRVHRRDLQSR